jgi:preprotein translocase SecE subunit
MFDKNANALAGASAPAGTEDAEETMDATGNDQATDAASQADPMEAGLESDASELEAEDLRLPPGAIAPRSTQEVRHGSMVDGLLANPFTRFFAEAGIELRRKVTWPQPRDAWNMTLVVIAMSLAVAVLLGAADLVLNNGLSWMLNHLSNIGPAAPTATPTP